MDTELPSPAQPRAGDGKTVLKAHIWARDPNDWYVETRGCNVGLFAVEKFETWGLTRHLIVDPFCGMGRILDAAAAAGHPTLGHDLIDREGASARHPWRLVDFDASDVAGLTYEIQRYAQAQGFDDYSVVSNPAYLDKPQGSAIARIRKLVALGGAKTAILMRTKWANGRAVAEALEGMHVRRVRAITPRPSMPPGAVILAAAQGLRDENGERIVVGGGKEDFAWYIFERGYSGEAAFGWCRQPKTPRKKSS